MRYVLLAITLCGCSASHGSTGSDSGMPDGSGGAGADGGPGSSSGSDGGIASSALTRVGVGEYETLFLVDGVVYGYGASAGLLGQGSSSAMCIPARPIDVPAGVTFVAVQGGLHQSLAIDGTGHVWTWGEVDQGLQGGGSDGGNGAVPFQIQTDADGSAFDHVIGIEAATANQTDETMYDVAWKDDGTVWAWGNLGTGLQGTGSAGGIVERPTQIALPLAAGAKVIQVRGASALYALADDGTVWAWGTADGNILGTGFTGSADGYTPRQVVNLPSDIADIAVGYSGFQYALTADGDLWGWGYRGGYLGLGSAYDPTPEAIDLGSVLALPDKVVAVAADFMTTHVILADGSLWGWGDDAMGLVGDGHELDYATTTAPYAWDFNTFDLPVWKPVQIASSAGTFVAVFAHSPFDFYDYAETADGTLYSWGRNKTGVLGNGVYPLAANGTVGTSSNMSATYPNSWDVTSPTAVEPLTVMPMGENSPYCIANPTATACD